MAGDWIKIEHATLDKPELSKAADMLGISDGDAFLLFCRYWVWLDQNLDESCPGLVPMMSRKSLDRKFKTDGFAAVLEVIHWAKFDDDGQCLTVTNWQRHNGKSAKSRAVEQRKKALQRAALAILRPDSVPIDAGPEKRRVLKPTRENALSTSKPVDNSGNGVDWTDPRSVDAYGKRIGKPCRPGESIARYAARLRGAA